MRSASASQTANGPASPHRLPTADQKVPSHTRKKMGAAWPSDNPHYRQCRRWGACCKFALIADTVPFLIQPLHIAAAVWRGFSAHAAGFGVRYWAARTSPIRVSPCSLEPRSIDQGCARPPQRIANATKRSRQGRDRTKISNCRKTSSTASVKCMSVGIAARCEKNSTCASASGVPGDPENPSR